MKLASRMSRIGVETAFDVLVQARKLEAQGRSIIHLEIGEPDFDTPRHIVEARGIIGSVQDSCCQEARIVPGGEAISDRRANDPKTKRKLRPGHEHRTRLQEARPR